MKIALCFSGHFRIGKILFPNLKRAIINGHSPDIYIHLWDEKEILGSMPETKMIYRYTQKFIPMDQEEKDFIVSEYNPKYIEFADNKQFRESLSDFGLTDEKLSTIKNFHPWNRDHRIVLSQYYSTFKVFEKALNSDVQYDLLIRNRFDNYFSRELSIDDLNAGIDSVAIPEGLDFFDGVNDRFAIGNPDTMRIYSTIFNHFYEYAITQQVPYHPERYLTMHLNNNNISIKRIPFLIDTAREIINGKLSMHSQKCVTYDFK